MVTTGLMIVKESVMKKVCLVIPLVFIASLAFAGRIQQHHMMIIGQEQGASEGCTIGDEPALSGTLGYNTIINSANPATCAGEITQIKISVDAHGGGSETIYIGSCYLSNGSTFTTRDYAAITTTTDTGIVTYNAPADFTSITVAIGDYIFWDDNNTGMILDRHDSAGDGYKLAEARGITPFTDQEFTSYSSRAIYLYGVVE